MNHLFLCVSLSSVNLLVDSFVSETLVREVVHTLSTSVSLLLSVFLSTPTEGRPWREPSNTL